MCNEAQQKMPHPNVPNSHVQMTCVAFNCPFCSTPRCHACGQPVYQARPIWFWNPYTAPFYSVTTTTGTGAA